MALSPPPSSSLSALPLQVTKYVTEDLKETLLQGSQKVAELLVRRLITHDVCTNVHHIQQNTKCDFQA